jgi:hypothetical protein
MPEEPAKNTFYGRVKLVAKNLKPKPVIYIICLDPLRQFVNSARSIQTTIDTQYQASHRLYETEAHLYQYFPSSILQHFFRELWHYTQELQQRFPLPAAPIINLRPEFKSASEVEEISISHLIYRDNIPTYYASHGQSYIDFLLPEIARRVSNYPTPAHLQYALNILLQHGIAKPQAKLLLARLASKHGDKVNSCQLYHSVYKEEKSLTYADYIRCLNDLVATEKWGEAKVIAQKARAGYLKKYGHIPFEVEDLWQQIKTHRQSK